MFYNAHERLEQAVYEYSSRVIHVNGGEHYAYFISTTGVQAHRLGGSGR